MSMRPTCAPSCRNVRTDAKDETAELSSKYEALKDSQRHGNAMLVKQLSSVVRDIAQLTDSHEALRGRMQEDSAQGNQLRKEYRQQQDALSETVQQLQQDLKHIVKEGNASSRIVPYSAVYVIAVLSMHADLPTFPDISPPGLCHDVQALRHA